MNGKDRRGMSRASAVRLEFSVIGLGILALLLIFQPFSLGLFAVGSGLVVLAGLSNNLLPMAQPGVPARSVIKVGLTVAMIFCIVIMLAIVAAHLYGVLFLKPPDPNTVAGKAMLAARPFYLQSFFWSLAGAAAVLALVIAALSRK